jgi:hypothetical protein
VVVEYDLCPQDKLDAFHAVCAVAPDQSFACHTYLGDRVCSNTVAFQIRAALFSAKKMQHEDDKREHEDDVDQAAGDVQGEAKNPAKDEYDANNCEHGVL